MKIMDFLPFLGVHGHRDPKMSDFGLHIWIVLQYIPHFVLTWNPQ